MFQYYTFEKIIRQREIGYILRFRTKLFFFVQQSMMWKGKSENPKKSKKILWEKFSEGFFSTSNNAPIPLILWNYEIRCWYESCGQKFRSHHFTGKLRFWMISDLMVIFSWNPLLIPLIKFSIGPKILICVFRHWILELWS